MPRMMADAADKRESVTSKAGERRQGVGVGPARDGLIDSLRYVCGEVSCKIHKDKRDDGVVIT